MRLHKWNGEKGIVISLAVSLGMILLTVAALLVEKILSESH